MASGMLAAEAVHHALTQGSPPALLPNGTPKPLEVASYEKSLRNSWIYDELEHARNIRPGFRFGLWPGLLHAALDHYVFRGKAPWTLKNRRV